MDQTFYFYDLETSGISPKEHRIMQFAGQRTDMNLKPIGKPDNILIKLSDEILPDPQAVIVTGITPQKTIQDGISEAEFLRIFNETIVQPNTIFCGFNTVRFDDEFMRYTLWRNYYDSYEWQWRDGCSRWDMLDVARLTRALRPDGISWPVDSEGKSVNKLELITQVNNLAHEDAHDALSDVNATIAVARLIKSKQPKLFEYLLSIRGKKDVEAFIDANPLFVHTSGRLPADYEKTAVMTKLFDHPAQSGAAIAYDLRQDPRQLQNKSASQLSELFSNSRENGLFVKTIRYNRCPALAPVQVLSEDNKKQLAIDLEVSAKHHKILHGDKQLLETIQKAVADAHSAMQQSFGNEKYAEARLYDSFIDGGDKTKASVVRAADDAELASMPNEFSDPRLREMLSRYKARNYPQILSDEERIEWEQYRHDYLLGGEQASRFAKFANQMQEVIAQNKGEHDFLLQELQLYAESILPTD